MISAVESGGWQILASHRILHNPPVLNHPPASSPDFSSTFRPRDRPSSSTVLASHLESSLITFSTTFLTSFLESHHLAQLSQPASVQSFLLSELTEICALTCPMVLAFYQPCTLVPPHTSTAHLQIAPSPPSLARVSRPLGKVAVLHCYRPLIGYQSQVCPVMSAKSHCMMPAYRFPPSRNSHPHF